MKTRGIEMTKKELALVPPFLEEIGILAVAQKGVSGFLPGCLIVAGVLYFDPQTTVSNLLHEAGHLAIIPTIFREQTMPNVEDSFDQIFHEIENLHPDHQLVRAMMQCGDCEATAWAWAAGKHLGIQETRIILNDEYEKTGRDVRAQVSSGYHFGINGLRSAGMCELARRPGGYPAMKKWVQDADWGP